jgi:hypothetical protein
LTRSVQNVAGVRAKKWGCNADVRVGELFEEAASDA